MQTDLAIIELTLQPRKFNHIPEWQGRSAQALFYSALHQINPIVSETIHDLHKWHPIMPKPFTMSTLTGAKHVKDLIEINPNRLLKLKLTTLHPHLTSIAINGIIPIWQYQGISLHDQSFWIRRTHRIKATYADLLASDNDNECIDLHFLSPTAFKQTNKGHLAKPVPDYVFGSLYRRWNSFADEQLPLHLYDVIKEKIEIVEQDTKQRNLSFARGRKGIIRGFYGHVRFIINDSSREARQLLNSLASFAPFSGIGIKTTIGMGQTVFLESD
ncbi:MAG: hypothetical protein Phog2KO_15070 [Phototrophicaceae bacterium]